MSNQPPYDSFRQEVPPVVYGPPGMAVPSASPFEYIPIDAPPPMYVPPLMQPPAYLYPLPYTRVAPAPSKWPAKGLALAGFVLGVVSILLWILPFLGDMTSLFGIALSILGWRAPTHKWMVMLGCALSAAALMLGFYNSALGSALFPH